MPIPLEDLFDMQTRHLQPQTAITSESPLEIVTPTAQWSYAVWFATVGSVPAAAADARVAISATIDVRAGRVGVGWTRTGSDDFVVERYVAEETDGTIVLRVPVAALPGRLMFRNVNPSGASRFALQELSARLESDVPPYPVAVEHRDRRFDHPTQSGQDVFDGGLAVSINRARLEFLERLGLPLDGKRVLDAGCGVGHHTPFYTARGCRVVGVDGRPENIAAMKAIYPTVEGVVGDLQEMDLASLGSFDVVHCLGLLYHLDSPVAALRR